MSVRSAHEICDEIERDLKDSMKNTEVMIHLESCENSCKGCFTKSKK